MSHGRVNILIPKFNMNKFNALFICTVINAEKIKYSYGRGMYSTEAENLYIKLPFTYDANHKKVPDYDYMEDYMKSMPFGDRI